jgi:hypothetical protein
MKVFGQDDKEDEFQCKSLVVVKLKDNWGMSVSAGSERSLPSVNYKSERI